MSSGKRKAGNFSDEVLGKFEEHAQRVADVHQMKKQATSLKNVATDTEVVQSIDVWDTLGVRQPTDRFNGDVNLRTLRTLLKFIDARGFERYVIFNAHLLHSPMNSILTTIS